MAPKKKVVEEKKIRLGRPGNNLKVSIMWLSDWLETKYWSTHTQVGIVGLPNVGKSSFFNTLSQTDLGKAANFPYATM